MRWLIVASLVVVGEVSGHCIPTEVAKCYVDGVGGHRVLSKYIELGSPSTMMSRDYCAQICFQHKLTIAGVEDGHQCMCDTEIWPGSPLAPIGECSTPCSGNLSESCGGNYRMNVFTFSCSGKPDPIPPPPPPPPPSPLPPPSNRNLCPDYSREYCKPSVPLEDRIKMVMGYMTTEDKMMTMAEVNVLGTYKDGTPITDRRYGWWNEALHGLRYGCGAKCATQFPEANALGCSLNTSLWYAVADAISTEARAWYRVMPIGGLSFFAPQLNMASNPLWGRNMECPGEDPYVTSVYAREYVRAMQGEHPSGILKTVCTPKHFTGQMFEGDGSNPWNNGTTVNRQSNDTRYPLHDLEKYYLPAFRAAMVDAKAGSVMCAYQGVNGVPTCANGFLLERVVRQHWGWEGFVVSDCDAIKTMMIAGSPGGNPSFGHAYSLDGPMAVQDGVYAGCDSNCGDPYRLSGMAAVNSSQVSVTMLDASIRRLLRPLFQLGLFDPPDGQPYTHYDWNDVNTPATKRLALEAARQSIVLLQNPTGLLPLEKGKRILMVGPHCNATTVLLGNYNGQACANADTSLPWAEQCMPPLSLSVAHFNGPDGFVATQPGVKSLCDEGVDNSTLPSILTAAREAEIIILAVGGPCHEGEGTDRDYLELPHGQGQLFSALNTAGLSSKMAVVIINGGPFAIDDIKDSNASVLQAGFPGQSGGQAIAEIIFGVVNPSGKLTTTVYPQSYAHGEPIGGAMPWMDPQVRPHAGFPGLDMTEGRTYMWYTGTPLFPFGHGLSYTTFSLRWFGSAPPPATVPLSGGAPGLSTVTFSVEVTNTGKVAGKETVLAYWVPPKSIDPLLKRELFGFQGLLLEAGQSGVLHFQLPSAVNLSTVAENGDRFLAPGDYLVEFSRGHSEKLNATVTLTGNTQSLRTFPSRWVNGHELTVDTCLEGVTDVIPHTERFLVEYKLFTVQDSMVKHTASGLCLHWNKSNGGAPTLMTCTGATGQQWSVVNNKVTSALCEAATPCCLSTLARTAQDLRRNVTVSDCDGRPQTTWSVTSSGFLRNGLGGASGTLCLAARSVGHFNVWS